MLQIKLEIDTVEINLLAVTFFWALNLILTSQMGSLKKLYDFIFS